jgi:hypothetical protein
VFGTYGVNEEKRRLSSDRVEHIPELGGEAQERTIDKLTADDS